MSGVTTRTVAFLRRWTTDRRQVESIDLPHGEGPYPVFALGEEHAPPVVVGQATCQIDGDRVVAHLSFSDQEPGGWPVVELISSSVELLDNDTMKISGKLGAIVYVLNPAWPELRDERPQEIVP